MPVEEDIRMLRQVHLNMLIRTTGVVTVATGVIFNLPFKLIRKVLFQG